MKATITANGKSTELELTKDQEKAFKKATETIMDRIKTPLDALEYNGETLEQFNHRTQFDTPGQKATKLCEAIALALREGKHLTKEDTWYYPYFSRVSSGVGLSFVDFDAARGYSDVGARLSVFDAKTATYFGKQFTKEWSEHLYNQ